MHLLLNPIHPFIPFRSLDLNLAHLGVGTPRVGSRDTGADLVSKVIGLQAKHHGKQAFLWEGGGRCCHSCFESALDQSLVAWELME